MRCATGVHRLPIIAGRPWARYHDEMLCRRMTPSEEGAIMLADTEIFFLGAGALTEAMLRGLTATATVSPGRVTVSNRRQIARLHELGTRYGVRASADKLADIARAELIVLAVKPYDVTAALAEVGPALRAGQLLVSVAAGVSTQTLEAHMPAGMAVVRAMPNTSSFVQESATAICAGRHADAAALERTRGLFAAIGTVATVEETAMDAVTGLSGSGPAYIYYVTEALLAAGIAVGLSAETSRDLLLQTLQGATRMLRETGHGPAALRRQVTSPNGTTMAGIAALDERGVRDAFRLAVERATARAREMGEELVRG
jgi:pyrroline-5-carboxylate reductase